MFWFSFLNVGSWEEFEQRLSKFNTRSLSGRISFRSFSPFRVLNHIIGTAVLLIILFSPSVQCFFPQYALQNIKTPYFILNSAYDVYQVKEYIVPVNIFTSWPLVKILLFFGSSITSLCLLRLILGVTGVAVRRTLAHAAHYKLQLSKVPFSALYKFSLHVSNERV